MAQGSSKLAGKRDRGGRASQKHSGKMRKGSVVKKPKRAPVATRLNESSRVTAAITRNIEKEMGQKVQQNGGALSILHSTPDASKGSVKRNTEVEQKSNGAKLSEPQLKFNPKKRFKL